MSKFIKRKLSVIEGPEDEVHIFFEGKLGPEILIQLVKNFGDKNKKFIISDLEKYFTKGSC